MTFAETWETATVGDLEKNPPDEGTFEVRLIDARAFESEAGEDYYALDLCVVDGSQYHGYQWGELRSFKSQGAANAAKTTLAKIGVDVDAVRSMSDMDEAVKAKVGCHFDIDVKRNGEYLNTYFNRELPRREVAGEGTQSVPIADAFPGSTEERPPLGDEDIPF